MSYDQILCGERLKELRKQSPNDMSQSELADRIGATKQAISLWENGNGGIPIDKAFSIAEVFHVTLDYVYGKSNERNPKAAGIAEYTGLSQQAAAALHELPDAFGADCADVLNDLILDSGFPAVLGRLAYLRKRSKQLTEADLVSQAEQIQQAVQLQHAVDADCGFGVVVTGLNALYYEADAVLRSVRRWIVDACGIRDAELAIAEKSKAAFAAKRKQRKGRKHGR